MEMPPVHSDSTDAQPEGSPRDDLQELAAIMAHRLRYFQRIAMRYLANAQDAEDAVQDAFLSAYRHLGQFRGQAQMSTWLTTIVINSARMQARARSRQIHISMDGLDRDYDQYPLFDRLSDSRPDPDDLLWERELREKMVILSSRLSPALRETFHLRAFDEFSVREVANFLGIRENAVKTRVSRARAHLRRMLQKDAQSSSSWKQRDSSTIENLHVKDIEDRRDFEKRRIVVASGKQCALPARH